jgi:hypothetical protein
MLVDAYREPSVDHYLRWLSMEISGLPDMYN